MTPPAALPDGWLSQIDPTSGRTYYVNLESGISQWEPPDDTSESEPVDLPSGWLSFIDPKTGKTYYADTNSGVTQWEPPTLAATTTTTMMTSSSATLPLPAGVPALPVGWIVLADESSGKAYYVNTKTGTSQWDPPTPPTTANEGTLGLTPTPPAGLTPTPPVLLPTPPITSSTTATSVAATNVLLPPGSIILYEMLHII